MKILPANKKYSKIVHLADVHIRLNKRHDEYREVFNRLFKDIEMLPKEETCIVIVGDLLHSKIDLQPECIELLSYFLTKCANMCPTVIVAGQHDAILSNKNRLDSLSPIIEAINHPTLFYLKSSGLYGMGNILFNNMSIFDDPDKYMFGKDIPAIYRNQYEHTIALFHGTVDQASLENGYSISNPAIMPPLFDYHDMALLGDIHYPGSLIMQNHGESLKGHGYSLWDLTLRTYTHCEVLNNFGYFTIEVQKGKLTTDLTSLPKQVRLRVKCFESIASEVKLVIADIKQKTNVVEITYVRMDQERDEKDIIPLCKDIVLTDLTNVDYQSRLITEFITKKLQITDQQKLDDILTINKNTNLLIKRDEFPRNLKWKPIKMEWSNTFKFGEDNVIDFTNMNGVYGIFGPNASGKCVDKNTEIDIEYDKDEIIKKLGFLPEELK